MYIQDLATLVGVVLYFVVAIIVVVAVLLRRARPSPSERVAQKEKEIARLNVEHRKIEAEEKFSDQSGWTDRASFSFEGSHVIDDFSALRRKNEEHERHLRERML